MWIEFISLGT